MTVVFSGMTHACRELLEYRTDASVRDARPALFPF